MRCLCSCATYSCNPITRQCDCRSRTPIVVTKLYSVPMHSDTIVQTIEPESLHHGPITSSTRYVYVSIRTKDGPVTAATNVGSFILEWLADVNLTAVCFHPHHLFMSSS